MAERRRRRGGVGAAAVAAVIVAAVATSPVTGPRAARATDDPVPAATQPAPPVTRTEPLVPRVGRAARYGVGGVGGRPVGSITEVDRTEAMQFMKEYAPESYRAITALVDPAQRNGLEQGIARAYLNYQQVKANNADGLYEVILRRVKVEDRIYGLTLQVRRTPAKDREGVIADLRAAVTDWSEVNLQERQLRLVRLERSAQRERKRLAEDNAHQDRLIQKRLDTILKDGGDDPWPPGGDPPHGEGSR